MFRSPSPRISLPLLILSATVWFTFAGTLKNQFVNWDDQNEISENPHFNPVTFDSLMWNWKHTQLSLYMPVTYMVWGGVAAIAHRDNPKAFHALNLVLHLVCTMLVFALILQLWKRAVPATIGALVFAVHPLQVEAVAWASGMYTLLSSAFSLGAIMAFVAYATRCKTRSVVEGYPQGPAQSRPLSLWPFYRDTGIRPVVAAVENQRFERLQENRTGRTPVSSMRFETLHEGPGLLPSDPALRSTSEPAWGPMAFYWVASLFYALALLTKAASVSVPLSAMAIDVMILQRPIRKSIRSLFLWFILAVPIVSIAKGFQDVSSLKIPPLWTRPVVALDAVGFYLRKIILPTHLIPDYGRNPTWVMESHNHFAVAVSVAIALIAIVLAGFAGRKFAWITAGVGLLLAGISPYLGLTPFDFQYVSTVADRYAYFGMIGIAVLAAGATLRSRSALAGMLIVAGIGITISRHQVKIWNNTNSLFNYTLKVNPNSLVSHNVFGYLAAKEGRFQIAEENYLQGLQIWPENATIQFNLGNLYMNQAARDSQDRKRLLDKALKHYSLATQYQPKFVAYRNSLAAALANSGQFAQAYEQWKMTLAIDPTYSDARNNLADMLATNGKREEARDEYHLVLRTDANNHHAIQGLMNLMNDQPAPVQR